MGLKCTKCGMPKDTVYYTKHHYNRRHCRVHNYKDNLLCVDCQTCTYKRDVFINLNTKYYVGGFNKLKWIANTLYLSMFFL